MVRFARSLSARISQASTADIAFLLLIFFISTTIFETELGISLQLPRLGEDPHRVPLGNVLVLQPVGDGRILCDDTPVTLGMLRPLIRDRLAENDRLVVLIQPSDDAPYQRMMDVLDEAKAAGAQRISLRRGARG